jgi:hypothetical protein
MAAIFANLQSGTTTTAPLAIAGTTLDSAGFANLPTIAAPDYMWLTLDPAGSAGLPEIVQVTAHTASATTLTIVRAQQSTVARQHLSGTIWRHSATKSDFDELPFRKLTTVGDTLYAGALNTTTRLPVGATGALLSVVGGGPGWSPPIGPAGAVLTSVGGVPVWSAAATPNGALLTVVGGVPTWTTSASPGTGARTAWIPTWTQTAAISKTVLAGNTYSRVGRQIHGNCALSATSAGTASGLITVALPVAAANADGTVIGVGYVNKVAAASFLPMMAVVGSSGTLAFFDSTSASGGVSEASNRLGTGFLMTIASGDVITFSFSYEAAAD